MNSQPFFGKQYVQVLITLALVGIIAALSAYAYYTIKQSKGVYTGETSISIRGEGEVFAKPDIGSFSFSVMAEGKDATEAQTKSAESINAIVAFLKEAGVEEKDIKTENYYLNPKYRYTTCVNGVEAAASAESSVVKGSAASGSFMPDTAVSYEYGRTYCPPLANPVIDGYEISQTVLVKVRDLTKSGDLITGVGSKGATNMSNLQFTIDDESALKAEARALAIADAKTQAEKLAKDLGVEIVRMTGFYEESDGGYPMPMYEGMGGDRAMSAKAVAPDVPIGENTIKSVVSISYEIKE
jgi:uncharacterized protein